MAKNAQNRKSTYHKNDLWIAPSLSFKAKNYQGDWKLKRVELDDSNRYLQLADIALGLAPVKYKTKRSA